MQLNLTAQERLVSLALPLMPKGGRVVFVTSHLAHFYGEKPVYAAYEPVAASKKAGEEALRARIPELAEKGISLVVVSGDLIEGTITPKLMERSNRGLYRNAAATGWFSSHCGRVCSSDCNCCRRFGAWQRRGCLRRQRRINAVFRPPPRTALGFSPDFGH
jgi:NAD(P)-dependent dehydrogenase (short-subunit alcohol dehydrogenase family)